VITQTRTKRLVPRLLSRIRYGGRMERRTRRYVIAAAIGCAGAWGLSLGYLAMSPKTYTSGFVLVLSGTGAGSSLNLPTVGQATSTSASPFASPELSPTENYRKMLLSNRLLAAAAEISGDRAESFPLPKVTLADQTKLISVQVTGRTAEQAMARAEAIRRAFPQMLDELRADEIQTRDAAYRNTLAGYKAAVAEARQRLIDHQARTGLVSIDQYGTIVASVERLRDMLRDTDGKAAQMRASANELARQLGATADQANVAMVLRSDPLFQALLDQLAKEDTEAAMLAGTRGQNNARLVDLQAERASTAARLTARAGELTGNKRLEVVKMRDLSIHDERARLFERLVGQAADAEALAAMQTKLASQIVAEQARVMELAPAASRLDDLRRDMQVAEAVFTSALARIDTNKADFYASFPLVQAFELPDLPRRASSPLPILAVAGGAAATILILASLVLTWLRTALLQKILKSV
jgi:uncharacterized protein involved in exopolysaccharide biosynthesis